MSLREYGGFICSVVDITSEKSAELAERKAAKDARERKEQQENFIDVISHEIRSIKTEHSSSSLYASRLPFIGKRLPFITE